MGAAALGGRRRFEHFHETQIELAPELDKVHDEPELSAPVDADSIGIEQLVGEPNAIGDANA